MKKLEFVGLKSCPRCRRAVAYLMTVDGEETLAIAVDAATARELSRGPQGREKSLTAFLVELLARSFYVPRQVVLDCHEEGFLYARVDLTSATFSCCPQEGVAIAASAGISLYAEERIFKLAHACHLSDVEEESIEHNPRKSKPTLH